MPRTTGRGGSGHSGSGFGGARGGPGSGRGPSGPGDIWAPFRRKDASVPTPMEWIRDWAQGRPNPIRSFSPAKVSWETGRDVFRQARDEPDTEIGRTLRREFAREGVSFGADRAVHFDPAKLEGPGRHLGPEFRRARRLDRDEPAAPPRAPDLDAPIAATPRRPRPRPLDLARRDDPLRGTLLGGGRGPDGPRGSRDTVARVTHESRKSAELTQTVPQFVRITLEALPATLRSG